MMACKIGRNRHGRLALRLHWEGRRSWEGANLRDTKKNREQLQRVADLISAEMRLGKFTAKRYLHFFPTGNRAAEYDTRPTATGSHAEEEVAAAKAPTVRKYFDEWMKHQQPPIVRPAQARDYRQHLTRYVVDAVIEVAGTEHILGDLRLDEVKLGHLRAFQGELIGTGLKVKTVRNIIDGSFRAMIRDARAEEHLAGDPFAGLKWPRTSPPKPDPFTPEERDRILQWFLDRKPFYYPFVFLLFHTGMRPSEATALRWENVDLRHQILTIRRSRYCGGEGAPKTAGSERTIRLLPDVCECLRGLMLLNASADDYVFTNAVTGGPLNQGEWAREFWHRPLRGQNIRHRKFYATRHTFISNALTNGVNLKYLAEYCGTSVAMIERDYGRFLEDQVEAQMTLLAGGSTERHRRQAAAGGAKPATFAGGSPVWAENPLQNKVVPTGFEPVSPT
jgi:integrase